MALMPGLQINMGQQLKLTLQLHPVRNPLATVGGINFSSMEFSNVNGGFKMLQTYQTPLVPPVQKRKTLKILIVETGGAYKAGMTVHLEESKAMELVQAFKAKVVR